MKAGWLALSLLIVVLVCCTRAESVLSYRMNSLTEQIMKGPTFFGDPIGRMFHTFRQRVDEQQSPWWPNFLYNDPTHPYPTQSEEGDASTPSFWEETVANSLKESKDDLLEKFDGLYIPAENLETEEELNADTTETESHVQKVPVVRKEVDGFTPQRKNGVKSTFVKQDSDTSSMLLHTPIDEPESQCSGRGQEVGDVKNICQRKDCHVTILRCPPNKQVPIDIEDYGTQNLTDCKVEEMKCMDTTITFRWEYTKIRELLCDDQRTKPEDGDLDHCSILTLTEGNILYNFTYSTPDDQKCWIDQPDCPHFCEKPEVNCTDAKCSTELHCIDGLMWCKNEPVSCDGKHVTCDDPRVLCNDHFPQCWNYSVTCDGDRNPCIFEENGEAVEYQAYCDDRGLIVCNNQLAQCDGHVISCADTERVWCHDAIKPEKGYTPELICTDTVDECEELLVLCDDRKLECPDNYHFVYNETQNPSPICLDDQFATYKDFLEWAILHPEAVEDEDYEDGDPYVIPSPDLCRIGTITFNCSIEHCHNRKIECPDHPFECSDQNLIITGSYPNYTVYCGHSLLQCRSPPPCDIIQRPCNPGETCTSVIYECDDKKPDFCDFYAYECKDSCWARDGDWECICPIDYMGTHCERTRPYLCDVNLLDPVVNCKTYDDPRLNKIETDPVCLEYSVYDSIRFTYSMTCNFTNTTDIEKSLDPRVAYQYWGRRGNEFAISKTQPEPRIMFKVYDFNHLSDTSQSILRGLTPQQLAEGGEIYFDLHPGPVYSSISHRNRFFLAGRLYFEVDLYQYSTRKPDGMKYRQSDRHFLDFVDYQYQDEEEYLSGFWYYVYTQLADPTLIIAIMISIVSIYTFVKYHQRYIISEELKDYKRFKRE